MRELLQGSFDNVTYTELPADRIDTLFHPDGITSTWGIHSWSFTSALTLQDSACLNAEITGRDIVFSDRVALVVAKNDGLPMIGDPQMIDKNERHQYRNWVMMQPGIREFVPSVIAYGTLTPEQWLLTVQLLERHLKENGALPVRIAGEDRYERLVARDRIATLMEYVPLYPVADIRAIMNRFTFEQWERGLFQFLMVCQVLSYYCVSVNGLSFNFRYVRQDGGVYPDRIVLNDFGFPSQRNGQTGGRSVRSNLAGFLGEYIRYCSDPDAISLYISLLTREGVTFLDIAKAIDERSGGKLSKDYGVITNSKIDRFAI